ncbi:MAG: ABC transporter permease [Candidatus Heimdallarchaeaceae archaeon]
MATSTDSQKPLTFNEKFIVFRYFTNLWMYRIFILPFKYLWIGFSYTISMLWKFLIKIPFTFFYRWIIKEPLKFIYLWCVKKPLSFIAEKLKPPILKMSGWLKKHFKFLIPIEIALDISFRNFKRQLKQWKKNLNVFMRNWMGVTGLVLMITIIILAIIGPRMTKYDPDAYSAEDRMLPPSWEHLLGTNRYGQDVFTVLLDSLRISLLVGIIAGSLTVIIGTTIGVASAYIGGWVDNLIMRITDVVLVLPALPLMLVLASLPFLWEQTHWSVIAIVYIIVFWPVSTRLIRGQALSLKQRAFIASAKASGAKTGYVIRKHILPNVFPLMLTMIITSMRQAILYESFLSYLGLGDPLNWTLGQMLHIAQVHAAFASGAWWLFFPPGIAIGLITLSFAFVGIALDEVVNPRLRKR